MNRRHFLKKLIQSLAVLSSLSWVGMKVPEIVNEEPVAITLNVTWSDLKAVRINWEPVWQKIGRQNANEQFLKAFYDTTPNPNRKPLTLSKIQEARRVLNTDRYWGDSA